MGSVLYFALPNFTVQRTAQKAAPPLTFVVVEDASRPRQSLRMRIRRLFGAKRLTTSGST
jgi:hypothetical protein